MLELNPYISGEELPINRDFLLIALSFPNSYFSLKGVFVWDATV